MPRDAGSPLPSPIGNHERDGSRSRVRSLTVVSRSRGFEGCTVGYSGRSGHLAPLGTVLRRLKSSARYRERERARPTSTPGGLVVTLVRCVPARGEVPSHPSGIEFRVLEADADSGDGLDLILARDRGGSVRHARRRPACRGYSGWKSLGPFLCDAQRCGVRDCWQRQCRARHYDGWSGCRRNIGAPWAGDCFVAALLAMTVGR